MTRIPLIDADSAPDGIREVLAESDLDLLGVIAHAESAFLPWLRYSNTLLRKLELDPLLRELAILEVAHLSRSEYEWTQHAAIALAVGATQAQVDAIAAGDDDGGAFNESERAVRSFTRAVVNEGVADEASVRRIVELLSERELVELLLVVGNYMGIARLIATVGLEAQAPVFTLPQRP